MNKTSRVVHCKKEPFDVYIGRPSKWGNPFIILENRIYFKRCVDTSKILTREEAINKYREWIVTQKHLMNSLDEIRGKILGCWCKPKACHGDVLVELCNLE